MCVGGGGGVDFFLAGYPCQLSICSLASRLFNKMKNVRGQLRTLYFSFTGYG